MATLHKRISPKFDPLSKESFAKSFAKHDIESLKEALNDTHLATARIRYLFHKVLSQALVDAAHALSVGLGPHETDTLKRKLDIEKTDYLHGLYILTELKATILRGLETPAVEVINQAFETMRASSEDVQPKKETEVAQKRQRQNRRAKRKGVTMGKSTKTPESAGKGEAELFGLSPRGETTSEPRFIVLHRRSPKR